MANAPVDFNTLLSTPAGEAKKPEALPVGDYPGIIKSYEQGSQNKNNTPYVRFAVVLTDWAEGVDPQEGVDLSKRQLRRDYYLTPDAMWRLDELIKATGAYTPGQSYAATLPQMVGASVTVEVQHYTTKEGEIGNQVGRLTGA